MSIPDEVVILLSGIPATGKGCFARYLVRAHSFVHYDLEGDPRGWPHPGLKQAWDADCAAFVTGVRRRNARVALDWGFPVHCLPRVKQLQAHGVHLIWFDGDLTRARQKFVQRAERRGEAAQEACFDNQVAAVQKAGYPGTLDSVVVVHTLSTDGAFLSPESIVSSIFPP